MRNIIVEELKQAPTQEQRVEIVERKGIGHPDTICDSIMNKISIELSDFYLKKFGEILHHNIDKGLLAAGETEVKFGGGKVTKPMLLIVGDRATFLVEKIGIPVKDISIESAKKWIKENLRFVDPDKHVKYQVELKQGSAALTDIFKRKGEMKGANDTSAAVGYAPLTPTEKAVLGTERFLNSKKFKKEFPESGEDIKIMGSRSNGNLDLTIAMAFVDKLVKSEKDYFRSKEEILERLKELDMNNSFKNVNFSINTLDKTGRGIDGIYLTVTGTSADGADSGQVGRGNRVNGLISLNRPAGSEAAAGKNPVSHVGKIYNVLSFKIANEIFARISGLKEVYVWMLSQIGQSIDEPKIVAAQVVPGDQTSIEKIKREIAEVVDSELSNLNQFVNDLAKGKYSIC
jgi:S-adenosylmethionine synthetase